MTSLCHDKKKKLDCTRRRRTTVLIFQHANGSQNVPPTPPSPPIIPPAVSSVRVFTARGPAQPTQVNGQQVVTLAQYAQVAPGAVGFDGNTGVFTAPETGLYSFTASGSLSLTGSGFITVYILANGQGFGFNTFGANSNPARGFLSNTTTGPIFLIEGQTAQLVVSGNQPTTSATVDWSNIEFRGDRFTVIFQAISPTRPTQIVSSTPQVFPLVAYSQADPSVGFSVPTGTFTAPVTGTYIFSLVPATLTVSGTGSFDLVLQLPDAGVTIATLSQNSPFVPNFRNGPVSLTAGQTVRLVARTGNSSTNLTVDFRNLVFRGST